MVSGTADAGAPLAVTLKSARVSAVVCTVEMLFVVLGSTVAAVMVAVEISGLSQVMLGARRTEKTKLSPVPLASDVMVQLMLPPALSAGVEHVMPLPGVNDVRVVPVGNVAVMVRVRAVLGPRLTNETE